MNIAYFDLDETIIGADSSSLWLEWAVRKKILDPALLAKGKEMLASYYSGKLDINTYTELNLTPIVGLTTSEVEKLVSEFITDEITHRYYHHALLHLQQHHEDGDKIVIISASSKHIVEPIARNLGIQTSFGVNPQLVLDEQLEEPVYTGKIEGTPAFREGKVKNLLAFLREEKLKGRVYEKSYAYSDSINDKFLLEFADKSFVINPNEELKLLANQKGWVTYFWQ
ncbi:HAD family hydrolase [Thorsellia kenyensis]|uniref:HAD family hydrolase n=1 Tax=Thorsellia kenyensis TaxID=1549888 RepID=A0ABV6C933_9GAMM